MDAVMDGRVQTGKRLKESETDDKTANETFLYLKLSCSESQKPVWSGWAAQSQSTQPPHNDCPLCCEHH